MAELTPRQRQFVAEYLVDLNATQAAIRAGYSAKTANRTASDLLSNPDIKGAVEAAKAARVEKTTIDAEWVLTRLAEEAKADLADIYDEHGSLRPVKDWPLIWRQGLVQGVEAEEIKVEGVSMGIVRKVKLSDRVRRLELIGKHVKVNAFQEVVKHTGLDGLGDRLERAIAREGAK